MKNIAIISEKLCFGGVTKVLLTLLDSFDYTKYKITLFLPLEEGTFESYINKKVIIKRYDRPVGDTSVKTIIKNYLKNFKIVNAFKSIYYYCLAKLNKNNKCREHYYFSRCFFPRICNEKYDYAICFNGLMVSSLETTDKVRAKGYFAWIHGIYFEKHKDINDYYYKKLIDKIVCVSISARDSFIDTFSVNKKSVLVIYNLFNKEEIILKSNEASDMQFHYPAFVTVGRLSVEKGQDLIPKIVSNLKKRGIHCKWYLVGEGKLREKIEEEIKTFNVGEDVILLGAKQNPYPFIKNCDIYVQPSFSEGYCTSTMEAKILKKLIVTTDVPGMKEQFVDGENALIVKPTVDNLEEAIYLLLNSQELRNKITDNLIDFEYDPSVELNKIYSLFEG